jgi:arylsulfatase
VLDFLKKSGLDQNTIVWYSTDNGPEHSSWPHGATTPFRGEKMAAYEGGVRVVSMLRWPGVIKPGQVLNDIQAHMDMFTTFAAAAGVPNVVEEVKREKKQYIDGVNNLEYWTGKSSGSARNDFLYYYESKLAAIRMGPWKFHFSTREHYYYLPTINSTATSAHAIPAPCSALRRSPSTASASITVPAG